MKAIDIEKYDFEVSHLNSAERPHMWLAIDSAADLDELDISLTSGTLYLTTQLNEVADLGHYFCEISEKIERGVELRGHFESHVQREERLFSNKWIGMKWNPVYYMDFVLNRFLPKTEPFGGFMKTMNFRKHKAISKAEILGRLVYSGFSIESCEEKNGLTTFTAIKMAACKKNVKPSMSLLFGMQRVGCHGRMIRVFKFRTMHPYSEFLQDYMKQHHGYGPNGKIADDFRLTGWGKVMRRFWIDELPQVINLAKGDMKIVGVRPVSYSYFNDLPKDIQYERRRSKPGCIPPYLSLNRKSSVGSVLKAEEEYMEEFRKAPLRTDVKYFVNAVYHIVFSRRRSA